MNDETEKGPAQYAAAHDVAGPVGSREHLGLLTPPAIQYVDACGSMLTPRILEHAIGAIARRAPREVWFIVEGIPALIVKNLGSGEQTEARGTGELRGLLDGCIQFHPEELDWVNAHLFNRPPGDNSFLGTFCWACLRADGENYRLMRPTVRAMMLKYPADPERLRVERQDRTEREASDIPGATGQPQDR
jgi:hypothetical protein